MITCFNSAKNFKLLDKVLKLGIGTSVLLTISIASILLLSSSSGIFNEKAYAGDVASRFGDFKCWDTLGTAIGVVSSLTLTDQFGELAGDFELTPREYCTAASKSIDNGGFPILFDSPFTLLDQHYQGWLINNAADLGPDPGTGKRINVQVNQFQHNFDLTLGVPTEILVPAAKEIMLGPGSGLIVPSRDTFHHWKCYTVSDVSPPVSGGPVTLTTQHGTEPLDIVEDPRLFCTPVEKENAAGDVFGDNTLPDHMLCYNLFELLPSSLIQPLPIRLIDQITVSGNDVNVNMPEKLCAPAWKACPTGSGGVLPDCSPLIAGSMTTIDSTMVLVAGAQGMLSWIVPVVVAGVGFVIVISRKLR